MKLFKKSVYNNKIFIALCTLAIIINSGNMVITMNPNLQYMNILFSFIFIIPIINEYRSGKLNIFRISLLTLLIMVMITFVSTGLSNPAYYFMFMFNVLFAFGFVVIYEFEDFARIFLKIMIIVSIISLFGYFLSNNTNVLDILPLKNNTNGVTYRVGYIFNYITIIPERNCGMFWEPGLFATFLNIALVFELSFMKKKPSVFRITLFVICILTTKSSAGYALLLFIFILVMLNKDKSKIKSNLYYIIIFILFLLSILIIFNYSAILESTGLSQNYMVQKLVFENLQDSSRYLAVKHNLSMFFSNPIFGVGIVESVKNIKYVADTSTTTYFMSIFGILGFQYTFYWVYGIMKNKEKTIFANIIILTIFIMIINKEPHGGIIFTWCIMFYFLKNSVINRRCKLNENKT